MDRDFEARVMLQRPLMQPKPTDVPKNAAIHPIPETIGIVAPYDAVGVNLLKIHGQKTWPAPQDKHCTGGPKFLNNPILRIRHQSDLYWTSASASVLVM
jgi:hypothetical protein